MEGLGKDSAIFGVNENTFDTRHSIDNFSKMK